MSVYPSPNFLIFIYYLSIYYIFKCGLHYLAMFKLFQRIIFACVATPRVLEGLLILPQLLTSQILVVFEICRFLWFFQNLDFRKIQKNEDLNPVVGYCEGTLWGCESCLWLWLRKSLWFSRYGFFWIFSKFFRKITYKKFHKTWNYHLCGDALSGYSQELRILSPNRTANFASK